MSTTATTDSHQRISAAASTHLKATEHRIRGAVSSHRLNGSLSFRGISAFLEATKSQDGIKAEQVFVGTVDRQLNISVVFHYKRPPPPAQSGKKRNKHEEASLQALYEKIDEALDRVRASVQKSNGETMDEEVLTGARQSLQSLLVQLKGPSDEEVVESWGLSASSPTTVAMGRPSLILSMRMSGGIPVPLSTLRRALGRSFNDGVVTTEQHAPQGFTLPITEQGAAIQAHGQSSLLIHASVAAV